MADDDATIRALLGAADDATLKALTAEPYIDPSDGAKILPGGQRVPRADSVAPPNTPRPERFGDTFQYMVEQPAAATAAFARGVVDPTQSPTARMLPENMNPTLRATLAQAGDVGMTGLSALGTAAAGTAGLVGEAFGGDATGERQLARDLMLMGQVAIPELAGVSSTTRLAGVAARSAMTPDAPTPRQQAARAAEALDVTPSLGMTGKLGGMTAGALEKVPFAGSMIARDAVRAVGEMEAAFHTINSRLGSPRSPDQMGEVLKAGGERYVRRFEAESERLYDAVGRYIPQDTRVPLSFTTEQMAAVKQMFDGNPELARTLGVTRWDSVLSEAAESGGLQWAALRRFRSQVGASVGRGSSMQIGDDALGDLKMLYGALTADMEAGARAAGSEAFDAFEKANAHYRRGQERITALLDKNATPERAFEAFFNMAKADRTTSDVHRMRVLKQTMEADEWGDVSASIVERMGRARAGQQNADGDAFSPATFLTNWNSLSKEAKSILLPADAREELNKLARLAETARAAGGERNAPNTGTVMGYLLVGAGMGSNPTLTGGALATAAVSAKAMTSPTFLRAVNRAARGNTRDLAAMAAGNGAYKRDAMTLLQLTAANQGASPAETQRPSALQP